MVSHIVENVGATKTMNKTRSVTLEYYAKARAHSISTLVTISLRRRHQKMFVWFESRLTKWKEQKQIKNGQIALKKVKIFGYIFQDTQTAFLHQRDNIMGLELSFDCSNNKSLYTVSNL